MDNFEQYSRKNSVEIHGIPQDGYTNTEQVVIKLAEALNITHKLIKQRRGCTKSEQNTQTRWNPCKCVDPGWKSLCQDLAVGVANQDLFSARFKLFVRMRTFHIINFKSITGCKAW